MAAMKIPRHVRFFTALAIGAAAFALGGSLGPWSFTTWSQRTVLAGDVFFAAYLCQTAVFVARLDAEALRRHAEADDEGLPLIVLITVSAVVISVGSIMLLRQEAGRMSATSQLLTIAGVALGWLTLHTVGAFHYASLFYRWRARNKGDGGLEFPGKLTSPDIWDFLYFALVIGMTAQVSDVVVTGRIMRRNVLGHSVIAFAYNTAILALAVSVVASGPG